jgi:hypothetical protein
MVDLELSSHGKGRYPGVKEYGKSHWRFFECRLISLDDGGRQIQLCRVLRMKKADRDA